MRLRLARKILAADWWTRLYVYNDGQILKATNRGNKWLRRDPQFAEKLARAKERGARIFQVIV